MPMVSIEVVWAVANRTIYQIMSLNVRQSTWNQPMNVLPQPDLMRINTRLIDVNYQAININNPFAQITKEECLRQTTILTSMKNSQIKWKSTTIDTT